LLSFLFFFLTFFFIFEAEVGLSSNAVDFRMSNLVIFFRILLLLSEGALIASFVRFYFSTFSSLGSFQQSPSDVQLMPANELCLPACLPALHIQYVLKMMEHVIVGFVFFLGF
jgi:hypothetical protein